MATLTDLILQVSDYLPGHAPEDGSSFTEAMAIRSINRGYIQFVKETGCMNRITTMDSAVGQGSYTLPLDVVSPQRVTYDDVELSPVTRELLNKDCVGWQELDDGTPIYWFRDSATTIRLVPAPDTLTDDTISVECLIVPSDVSGGVALLLAESPTLSPGLPAAYQNAPALYAVYDIAAHIFPDDNAVQASGQMALREYQQMVKDFTGSMVVDGAFR